jgi:hypothetical protein
MKNKTIIKAVLAAGSAASPFFYEVGICRRLCHKTCAESTPVFAPAFSFVGVENVGTNQYLITIHVEGVIHYTPCGCGQCAVKAETVSENFTVPYYGTAAPATVTLAAGATDNSVAGTPCNPCSADFVSRTPLSITIA